MLKQNNSFLTKETQKIEDRLDLSEITIRHGVHSYRYGTSNFLSVIFDVLEPKENDIFYDLGSGYGLVLKYASQKFPNVRFKGIEILKERYDFSMKLKAKYPLKNVEFYNCDMFSHDFSDGTIFYLFNPLFGSQYAQLLDRLKAIAVKHQITIVAESKHDVFDAQDWLQNYCTIHEDVLRNIQFFRSTCLQD